MLPGSGSLRSEARVYRGPGGGPSWGLLKIIGLDLAKTPGDVLDPLPRTREVPALIPLAIMLIVIPLPIAEQVGIGIGGVLHSWCSRDGGPLRSEVGGQRRRKLLVSGPSDA